MAKLCEWLGYECVVNEAENARNFRLIVALFGSPIFVPALRIKSNKHLRKKIENL